MTNTSPHSDIFYIWTVSACVYILLFSSFNLIDISPSSERIKSISFWEFYARIYSIRSLLMCFPLILRSDLSSKILSTTSTTNFGQKCLFFFPHFAFFSPMSIIFLIYDTRRCSHSNGIFNHFFHLPKKEK